MLAQEKYDLAIAQGGCTYGGTKGQGKTMCGLNTDPGEKYCPRHKIIAAAQSADKTAREHASMMKPMRRQERHR